MKHRTAAFMLLLLSTACTPQHRVTEVQDGMALAQGPVSQECLSAVPEGASIHLRWVAPKSFENGKQLTGADLRRYDIFTVEIDDDGDVLSGNLVASASSILSECWFPFEEGQYHIAMKAVGFAKSSGFSNVKQKIATNH